MRPACANCKFKVEWNPVNDTTATCIRLPPVFLPGGEKTGMPAVKKILLCGEYRRRRWWHRTPKQFEPVSQVATK